MIRVLIANHHRAAGNRLRAAVRAERDIEVVGDAGSGETAIRLARELRPQVLILDLSIPGVVTGLEVIRALAPVLPDVRIVVFSLERHLRGVALSSGATSFVWKEASNAELLREIRRVARASGPGLHPSGERLGE